MSICTSPYITIPMITGLYPLPPENFYNICQATMQVNVDNSTREVSYELFVMGISQQGGIIKVPINPIDDITVVDTFFGTNIIVTDHMISMNILLTDNQFIYMCVFYLMVTIRL